MTHLQTVDFNNLCLPSSHQHAIKDQPFEIKCSFGSDLDNPQEVEDFILKEGDFFSELLKGKVTNFSNNISKFVVELVLLPEKDFFDFPVGLVIINERCEDLVENVQHVLFF